MDETIQVSELIESESGHTSVGERSKAAGRRIRDLRKAANMTQQELARRSGVPLTTLRRYEGGGSQKLEDVYRIAEALGLSVGGLLGDSPGELQRDLQIVSGAIGMLGVLDPMIMRVEGDSMEPTLRDGGVVIIDQAQRELRDGLLALRINERVQLRRVQVFPGRRVRLIPDNPSYQAIELQGDDAAAIDVVGRVVWSGGRL
jgi:DNA-binding XRE family transcriptional regulator